MKSLNVKDNQAYARAKMIRTGPRKMDQVVEMIRGKDVFPAIQALRFSKKRISDDVRKVLESAVANAENNHGLNVDRLKVAEAWVGKSLVMKRYQPRARGRATKIEKPFSNLTIVVEEKE